MRRKWLTQKRSVVIFKTFLGDASYSNLTYEKTSFNKFPLACQLKNPNKHANATLSTPHRLVLV